jgi:molybdate transport system substrate-binding protein
MKVKTIFKLFIFIVQCALLFVGCNKENSDSTLLIAVAASARPAIGEIAAVWEKETSEKINLVTGSSGVLMRQTREGAPYDLFLSADMNRVVELADAGVIDPDSIIPYALGVLVLWTPENSPAPEASNVKSIIDGSMRIGMANPRYAPYGIAAKQVLENLALWDDCSERIIFGENVGHVLQYARSGNVDAAFLPRALVLNESESSIILINSELHEPIIMGMGIVKNGRSNPSARKFYQFILNPKGQAILKNYGFHSSRESGLQ